MILLVVGLVAVLVVVFIAVILSIRLGHGDEHDEPDLPSRGRDRQRADEDEHWLEHGTRRAPATAARGAGSRGRRGEDAGYADRGAAGDRDLAARGRAYDGPPRRPARADAAGYREPAAARSPVPAAAQARGRYDTGPQRWPAGGDFPSAGHPSMDFVPVAARHSGGQPPAELPAADYGAMDHLEDRPEPRRKAATANGKSRSRQRGKRSNDADWPTTEWDELSDEQYWAELSADKPLAAMAKPSRAAGRSGAKAPVNGSAKRAAEPPATREPRRARTPAPTRAAREAPSRNERTEPREPVTERIPVRTRQQPPAPGGRRDAGTPLAGAYTPGPRPAHDTGPQARRDPLQDSGPWARDTGSHPVQDTGPHASRDTRPWREQPRRSAAADRARDRDMAMLAGLASTPPPVPGALDDDPLTSPSFSLKAAAADSRSYGSSRKHARPSGHGAAPGNGTGNGTGSYPAADDLGAGRAYPPAPPAAPMEQWDSAPPAPAKGRHSVGYRDPYQHAGPSASHRGYIPDPLGGYPPAREAPRYAEPASPAYQTLPDPPMAAPPYANRHAQHAHPGQFPHPGGGSAGGYTNGYHAGYGREPYAGEGYEPYPFRG